MTILESIWPPPHEEIAQQIRENDSHLALELLERLTRPLPTQDVSDWVEQNVAFDEPKFRGAFNFRTRHYVREPLDLWRRDVSNDITDEILCWATRTAKTRTYYGGLAYRIALDPVRALITKPMKQGAGGSRNDAKTKFVPMLKASPGLEHAVAKCDRNALNNNQQMLNGSIMDWEGTGSPKQLSSNPDDVVVQDECDGYLLKGETEAHPSILADERTKDASNPLRFKCSSPTIETGVIWQHLMRSDIRRRFLPCPRCSPLKGTTAYRFGKYVRPPRYTFAELVERKFFMLAWNEQYHVLPTKLPDGTAIPIAHIQWDKAAKSRSGDWDLAKVVQTAHFICPHCSGPIQNFEKEWMDELGQWHLTKTGAPGYAGFQLSSLYVTHDETAWGILAKKFLMACESGQTMKGFINNDLAEVDVAQEYGRTSIESPHNFSQTDWVPLMTVDFQKLWPYLWFLVQKFSMFKLQPPIKFTDGKPDFVAHLDKTPKLKQQCEIIVAGFNPAWVALAEILRFDPCTGEFPPLDWLISNNVTGEKLVKLFRETCAGNTMDFGRYLFRQMGQHIPKGGDSEIIAAGHCELSGDDAWIELRELQQQFHIGEYFLKNGISPNRAVSIDSGYAEEHNPEVLRKCFESGFAGRWHWYDPATKNFSPFKMHAGCLPAPIDCWIPFKGYPISKRWRKDGSESSTHWGADDPFKGLAESDKYRIQLLEAASEWYFHRWMDNRERQKEVLTAIGEHRGYRGNLWTVSNDLALYPQKRFTREDFERHMNAKGRNSSGEIWERGTGGGGKRKHPDHLNDCARNMYPLAEVHGFFSYEPKTK